MKFKRFYQRFAIVCFVLFGITLLTGIAIAQGAAQAFAVRVVTNVDGTEAQIWTAQQPSTQNNFRASPVGVCTTPTPPCSGPLVETGYNKGDNSPNPNVLQQYASYLTQGGAVGGIFGLGNLADNTWYTFTVHRRVNTTKWFIKRNGVKVWDTPNIGFSQGNLAICGAEAEQNGTDIAVQCANMSRRVSGTWTLFDYTSTQTSSGYCVYKPYQFGAVGWGPC